MSRPTQPIKKDGKGRRIMNVGDVKMTPTGMNPSSEHDYFSFIMPKEETKVPHEDVDNDDQRKMDNRMRHGSYRK